MPETTTIESGAEQEKPADWIELAAERPETVSLDHEGRPDVMGGQVVAKLELGGADNSGQPLPAQEVHVLSVHSPADLDYQNLLKWNKTDEMSGGRTVLVALDPQGNIAASALLFPGVEYVVGREGNVGWFKYGVVGGDINQWTPFDDNPSISRNQASIDVGARHVVIEKNAASQSSTRLSRG